MPKINKLLFLLLLPALLAGCSSITNLTPTQYPRDPSGYYQVEAQWNSNARVIRPGSFKPMVMVNFKTYPMQPVPLVEDRWQAFIPVSANTNFVLYRYKFDYMEDAIPRPQPGSLMSAGYELHITGQ